MGAGQSWLDFLGRQMTVNFSVLSIELSAYASPETAIRFVTSPSMTATTKFKLDNIQVQYTLDVISTDVVEAVYDTFSAQDYANNDGNAGWLGDWTEINDDSSPTGGYIQVLSKQLLQITHTNHSIQRAVDLSSAASAKPELRLQTNRPG